MEIEFDPGKNESNRAKHGIDFAATENFDFSTALMAPVKRNNETRQVAVGYIAGRLHVLVYTKKTGAVRVISLRKANKREQRTYHEKA